MADRDDRAPREFAWTPDELSAASTAFANSGNPTAALNAYRQARRSGASHDDAIQSALSAVGSTTREAGPADPANRAGATPPTPPAPPTGGGGGGGLGGNNLFTQPFPGTFQPPAEPTGPPGWLGQIPQFHPPAWRQPPPFAAPTLQDAMNEPGYQFAADEGRKALERGAAAKGLLHSGGTLKDILAWGGNFAAGRYGDVYNRASDTYERNYKTQFFDPYQAAYKSAWDVFDPQFRGWQTQGNVTQRQGEVNWNRAFDVFKADYERWRNLGQDVWGRNVQAVGI